ncbi:MAG: M48 family metalloprotease, partial [Nitriliruptor sp.]
AVSRQREYLADATAADLLRDPQSMVNALRRLDQDPTSLKRFEAATAHLWFEEPNDTRGRGQEAKFARRFATHPTMAQRIERLASLNAGTVRTDAPLPPRPDARMDRPDAPPPGTPPVDLPPPGGGWPPPGGAWPPPGGR